MSEKIAADLQKQLKMPKLDVKFQPVTSQNRIPLVQNGTVDLECGSTTNNAARQKDVAFAMTTYVEEGRIVVKANSPIKGIADLNGKTVATTTGTTSVQTLRKNKKAANMDFKEVFGKDHADSFLLLESGRADAFVMDGQILAGLVSKSKNPADYKILGEVLSVEPIACMMRKDDPAFQKAVDASIQAMVKSGDLAKMYDKWFVQAHPAVEYQGRPAAVGRDQASVDESEHEADGRVRRTVGGEHGRRRGKRRAGAVRAGKGAA